jgi:hypothetical protein
MLPSHIRLGLPSGQVFRPKLFKRISHLSHACYMPRPSHPPWGYPISRSKYEPTNSEFCTNRVQCQVSDIIANHNDNKDDLSSVMIQMILKRNRMHKNYITEDNKNNDNCFTLLRAVRDYQRVTLILQLLAISSVMPCSHFTERNAHNDIRPSE